MKRAPLIGTLPLALAAAGWSHVTPAAPEKAPASSIHEVVAHGNNELAVKLLRHFAGREGNLCFSPVGLRTVLGMTYMGAGGQTAAQMAEVLCFDDAGKALHDALAALPRDMAMQAQRAGNELRFANALWSQEGFDFHREFVHGVKGSYGADWYVADFAQSETARAEINDWTSRLTKERIPELLRAGDLDAETLLVLVNALSFDGSWATPFDAKHTRERTFFCTASGGVSREVSVPLMFGLSEVGYRADDELQIVELPYAGDALSMVVLLPRERDGLAALESKLSADRLATWIGELATTEIGVFLPRFAFSAHFELKEALAALGMPDAFDQGLADFSGMTDAGKGVWIDDVIHEARIAVDEQGTEGAAAAAVVMTMGGGAVRADHPFLFLIRDR